ncbi:MAG: sulfur carrier protein ThiS [Desulfobulbaceae bacterium]|nr:sulfur carrier protein ThiS [Desulfobulbaceae bacterium]HIJ37120.1 sulfur carrier protein ThiS [Deltaproteobacteria bacterium]
MEITVNGMKQEVPEKASILELIDYCEERDVHLVVEFNGSFVYPKQYETIRVSEGDTLEFIHPDFGG